MATSLSVVVLGSEGPDFPPVRSGIGHERLRPQKRLANRPIARFMLHLVSRSVAPTTWLRLDRASWFIWLATAAAVIFSVAQPATRVYSFAAGPAELGPGQAVYAALAFACYLPIQIWLVLSLARGHRAWPQWIGLAAMATVIFAVMPLVGVGWVGMIPVLGALTCVTLRPPWSVVGFGVLLAAPGVLTSALGAPDFALYFTMGILLWVLPLVFVIWMIDVARQLQRARLALAEQAVVRERLRVDRELSRTVGDGLRLIAASGQRAAELASTDPPLAARELKALVKNARDTLSEARKNVRRYRETSLRAELETAAMLLEAAGVSVQLDVASADAADAAESERARLRREIAHLLAGAAPRSVTIRVETVDGRIRYQLRADSDQRTVEASTR